jgi:predicted ABC-type ATPase
MEEDRLSQKKHDLILENIKQAKLKATSREKPRAILLAGQPGSGKSYVREEARDYLNSDGKGVIIIDPDDLRVFHPRYVKHAESDSSTSAGKVHYDASLWAKELRSAAIEQKMNIVVDGTLSNSQNTVVLCKDLKKNGYDIEVRALAVDRKASLESIQKRHEEALERRRNGKTEIPRYVSQEIHDEAYQGMPSTIALLEKNKLTDRISVVDRNGNVLYCADRSRIWLEGNNAKMAIEKGRREMGIARETRAIRTAKLGRNIPVSRRSRTSTARSSE